MSENLPTVQVEKEVLAAFNDGSPLQRLFGETLRRVGGIDFIQEWAEDNPTEFVRVLMAANPALIPQTPTVNTEQVNVNIHPSLTPGPLDVVSDQ